jgi:hypothetical protein
MATDFDSLTAGLRRGAAGRDDRERAAVELLIWHAAFLRRRDFFEAAVGIQGDAYYVSWDRVRRFAEHAAGVSTSQRTVLELAAWIASDPLGLSRLGHVHAYKAAEALAAALGQRIEGLIPEPGHTHPDFIPGTPETCGACAREAKDEGRRR